MRKRTRCFPDVADLQLLFAQLNNEWFGGEIPAHRIAYNSRFSSVAGRITYNPPLIELSPRHFEGAPKRCGRRCCTR